MKHGIKGTLRIGLKIIYIFDPFPIELTLWAKIEILRYLLVRLWYN
jgi:hypothetical protein